MNSGADAPGELAVEPSVAAPAASTEVSEGYRRYVLALLCLVYLFNFVDRQILVILQVPIRREFDLSDGQLGLLTGFAFALVYSTLGVPIAHLADRTSRKNVISIALAFWSVMTALGGFATGFGTLALCRVGVGIGEAGCSPPATSLLADYFPPRRRSRANAIYSAAIYGGYLIAFVAGGQISEHLGWRWALFLVGLPGLLLSLCVWLTLREPARGSKAQVAHGQVQVTTQADSLVDTLAALWAIRSFRWLIVASSLHAFATLGVNSFMPLFLARSHHMTQSQIGNWLGPVSGLGGMLGAVVGGYLSDRLAPRDRRWPLRICALSVVLSVPFSFVTYLHSQATVALLSFAPAMLLGVMYLGPSLTVLQELAGPRRRAVSVSVFLLFNNLLGLGAGAWTTGLLSDALAPHAGTASLRYALCAMVAVNLVSFACYAAANRTVRADIDRAR